MTRLLGHLVFAGGLLIASAPAYAGDAEAGRVLARTWCAYCHVVEAGQKQASDIAPPFARIANDPSRKNWGPRRGSPSHIRPCPT